jgi:GTP cyclohydrolase I
MYVGLPHHFKGTHMSRFVEILNAHEREITVDTFQVMLREMVDKLEAQEGRIEMSFPYFVEKAAPVSGVRSLMDYEVTFVAQKLKGEKCFSMKVLVPVTSLCPCSKKISEYGAHNQRSHVTVPRTPASSSGSRRSSTWSRSRRRASSTACSSARTRSSSPSAPTTTRSSSRTWCAT